MPALITAIIALVGVLSGALILLTPEGRKGAGIFLGNIIRGALDIAGTLAGELPGSAQSVTGAFSDAIQAHGGSIQATLKAPFGDLAKASFAAVADPLIARGPVTPDKWKDNAGEAMADAFGLGLASFGVSAAFEAIFPEKLNVLNGVGPVLATMAGFAEVTDAAIGPLMQAAIKKPATYDLQSKFRPNLPAEMAVSILYSRGLIDRTRAVTLMQFHGYSDTDIDVLLASAFRPLSPMIMQRALLTGALDDSEIADSLKYAGYRDVDIERMKRVARELALAPYKQKLLVDLERSYAEGDIPASQFDEELTALHLPDGADELVRKTVEYRKLTQLLDIYRKGVSTGYRFGVITDADYVPTLERGGIAEQDANSRYFHDTMGKQGREHQAEQRAAARQADRQRREAIRLAEDQYLAGSINEASLAAALALAGVPAAEVALLTALAITRRNGRLRLTFGLMLEPDKALELREKVAALKEQVTKKLVLSADALAQLKGFGIPDANANALISQWAAQAYKELLPT